MAGGKDKVEAGRASDVTWPRQKAPAEGMTIRDLFAAHALAGLMSLPYPGKPEDVARKAFDAADAMLAAREPRTERSQT